MMKIKKFIVVMVWAVALHIGVTTDVYAYLDPGTGSLLLQGLIASIAAGWAALTIYGSKIRGFFSKNKKLDDAQTDAQGREDE